MANTLAKYALALGTAYTAVVGSAHAQNVAAKPEASNINAPTMGLRDQLDVEKKLSREASANSEGGKFIGVFLSTTPRDEEAFSAAQWEERVKNYIKSKGYEAKVSIAPGQAFMGSKFQISVNQNAVVTGNLSELNRAALDGAINAQMRFKISQSAEASLHNNHE